MRTLIGINGLVIQNLKGKPLMVLNEFTLSKKYKN